MLLLRPMLGMMLGRMLMIQLVFMGRLLSWDVGAVVFREALADIRAA